MSEQIDGKYVIIDLRNMDFMKNEEGVINYYDTEEEAINICGMYEFENAWVMKLIYNHKESVALPLSANCEHYQHHHCDCLGKYCLSR